MLRSRRNQALLMLVAVLALSKSVRTQPATITVCASGCTYNNSQLQTAVNAAAAGDTVLLQEGFTYTLTLTLPVKAGAGAGAITTIRTGVNATGVVQTPATRYPAAGFRVCPTGFVQDWYDCSTRSPYDVASRFAKIVPSSNGQASIDTVDNGAGTPASYYTVQWVELVANSFGDGALLKVANDTNNAATGTIAMIPHHFVFDQIVIRGDAVSGQFRGTQLDGGSTSITNSHIYDIKAIGEGQAIWANGPGPVTLTNNYVSGGTEVFFTGGAGTTPEPEYTIQASPAPTTTTFTLDRNTDLFVEQGIAIQSQSRTVTSITAASDAVVTTSTPHGYQVGWEVDFDGTNGCTSGGDGNINSGSAFPQIKSVQSTTVFTVEHNCATSATSGTVQVRSATHITGISGNNITVSPALAVAPASGEIVNTGMVINGITTRYNVFTRPSVWFTDQRIVPLPTNITATPSSSGGTLTAGTYGYRVLASYPTAQGTVADSGAATEVTATTTGTTGKVTIAWTAVANATNYRVYGRTPGGQTMYWDTASTSLIDTGSAGTAGSVDVSASRWQVKNVYELKQGRNITAEYNIIEYSWQQGQNGPCVLWTGSMQNNDNFSAMIRDVTFRYNEVRHCNQAMQIAGMDALPHESPRSGRININNNLFWDTGGQWSSGGNSTEVVRVTTGGGPRLNGQRAAFDVTFDRNTFGMNLSNDNSYAMQFLNCHRDTTPMVESPIPNMVLTNNIMYAGTYGIASEDSSQSCTWVTGRLTVGAANNTNAPFAPTTVIDKNVIAGAASCSVYTDDDPDTLCPSTAALEAEFAGAVLTNRANYALKAGSPYLTYSTTGGPIGADIATISTAMLITESGNNSGGGGGGAPLTIDTSSPLPTAFVAQAYSQTLGASGGTPPYTWAHTGGTLPTGLTFNTGTATLSGTPTTAVTNRSLTFRVTDSAAQQVSKTLVITVLRLSVRASRYNWTEGAFFVNATAPTNPGDSVRVGDQWWDLTTGTVKYATSLGPPITWENALTDLSSLNAGNLAAGTVPLARLGISGTPSTTTFLRGDNTWATPSGGASTPTITFIAGAAVTYSDTPSGGGEFPGAVRNRVKVNFSGITQCALTAYASAPGIAATDLRIEYWTGSAWATTGVSVTIGASGGLKEGSYQSVAAGARADLTMLRMFLTDGDGAADPTFTAVNLLCK